MFAARSFFSIGIDTFDVARARIRPHRARVRAHGYEMSLYRSLANAVGTLEALALAPRLAAWHDAMVVHQRRARGVRGALCDGDCPHAEAESLWSEALDVYGERAHELRFLRAHGAASSHEAARRVVEARL